MPRRLAVVRVGLVHVEVRVKGAIGPTIASAFDDVAVRTESVLSGDLVGDGSLHGLLERVRAMGLQVIDVHVSTPASPRAAE